MKYCTHCGGEVSTHALFCPSCGVRLSSGQTAPQGAVNPHGYDRQVQGDAPYEDEPYDRLLHQRQSRGGYYPQPDRANNPPGKVSMAIAMLGLAMSIFLNPVLTYPVIAYGIHLSNKELRLGRTTKTTARNICTAALFIAIGSHVISLALQIMGYNIYQSI